MLREAVSAEHISAFCRLERHLAVLAAVSALRIVHLSRAAIETAATAESAIAATATAAESTTTSAAFSTASIAAVTSISHFFISALKRLPRARSRRCLAGLTLQERSAI